MVGRHGLVGNTQLGKVVPDGRGQNEIAIGQTLHQRAGTQTVRTMVGEVSLTNHKQALDRTHQVVVDPQTAHGVVRGWENPHGNLVGILVGNALIHVEQIAVLGSHRITSHPRRRVAEIQVDTQSGFANAAPLITDLFGTP